MVKKRPTEVPEREDYPQDNTGTYYDPLQGARASDITGQYPVQPPQPVRMDPLMGLFQSLAQLIMPSPANAAQPSGMDQMQIRGANGTQVLPDFGNQAVFGQGMPADAAPPVPQRNPAFQSDEQLFGPGYQQPVLHPLDMKRPPVPAPNPQFHNLDSLGGILAAAPPPGMDYLSTKPKPKKKKSTDKKEG